MKIWFINVSNAAKNYWAKDIIFLLTSQDEVGMQAWINSYMGIHSTGKAREKIKKRPRVHNYTFVVLVEKKEKRKKKNSVVGRIRTCAGRAQWISSPSP